MKIRLVNIHDADAILALQRISYQSEANLYPAVTIPPLQQNVTELQAEFTTNTFLKAVDHDKKIIGSVRACLKDGTCAIGRLIVHPNYQRQGIGSQLMYEIESCFSHATRYELFTGDKSVGNIRLYEKLGYAIFKSIAVNEHLTLIYMQKRS